VRLPRSAGVLLHPTSLPGPNGIGELGVEAARFIDRIADAGITLWQVLPLGPTGFGDSPYQVFSAFAGNPLLIATPPDDADGGPVPPHTVDFGRVIPAKRRQLARLVADTPRDDAYRAFVHAHADWLPDYALFMALKDEHGGRAWTEWAPPLAQRDPAALADARHRLADAIEARQVEQFLFFTQFDALRRHATARGVRLMGDLPIYVAHDSADVWANPRLFRLRPDGRPAVQAGVPPDYFSATGQLWGNPIYDWDAMRADGFAWWIRRTRALFQQFDLVRIDHFRGFEAYWEVPGDDTTAVNGRWMPGPRDALFRAIHDALGPLAIIAENLGHITPEVEALRQRWGYPGMCILQFAFGTDAQASEFRPHNYPREAVVYTGTHDNDTVVGWWHSTGAGDSTRDAEQAEREKAFAARYLDLDGREIHWAMIRTALASVCDTAIIPLQDILGLGSDARMNLPGRDRGNWGFRFTWEQLTPDLLERLRTLVATYDR
jgi:4-alpha-glucanotransferase